MSDRVDGFRLRRSGGLLWIACEGLDEVPGLAHGFSTRVDGDADFDLGPAEPADAAARSRRRRLLAAVGIAADGVTAPRQVHGVELIEAGDGTSAADGVVALRERIPSRAPSVRTADCLPILLAAADASAVAAVHAGWRGTTARIAERAVARLGGWGVAPSRLVAALGPAIGSCCYQVGPEVVAAVAASGEPEPGAVARPDGGDRFRLDLSRAVARQLERSGVPAAAIHRAPWCTRCRRDLFFSYRRDGAAAGRMMACIGWRVLSP